jgi:hypothetical protein
MRLHEPIYFGSILLAVIPTIAVAMTASAASGAQRLALMTSAILMVLSLVADHHLNRQIARFRINRLVTLGLGLFNYQVLLVAMMTSSGLADSVKLLLAVVYATAVVGTGSTSLLRRR